MIRCLLLAAVFSFAIGAETIEAPPYPAVLAAADSSRFEVYKKWIRSIDITAIAVPEEKEGESTDENHLRRQCLVANKALLAVKLEQGIINGANVNAGESMARMEGIAHLLYDHFEWAEGQAVILSGAASNIHFIEQRRALLKR